MEDRGWKMADSQSSIAKPETFNAQHSTSKETGSAYQMWLNNKVTKAQSGNAIKEFNRG
jgi:hypothetical protein